LGSATAVLVQNPDDGAAVQALGIDRARIFTIAAPASKPTDSSHC